MKVISCKECRRAGYLRAAKSAGIALSPVLLLKTHLPWWPEPDALFRVLNFLSSFHICKNSYRDTSTCGTINFIGPFFKRISKLAVNCIKY